MKRKKEPIEVLLKPINQFLHQEASGGILLMICTVIALAWANSPWSDSYHHLWHTHLVINLGNILNLDYSIHHWINDGLMVIFFFTVGLEIKENFWLVNFLHFKSFSSNRRSFGRYGCTCNYLCNI